LYEKCVSYILSYSYGQYCIMFFFSFLLSFISACYCVLSAFVVNKHIHSFYKIVYMLLTSFGPTLARPRSLAPGTPICTGTPHAARLLIVSWTNHRRSTNRPSATMDTVVYYVAGRSAATYSDGQLAEIFHYI